MSGSDINVQNGEFIYLFILPENREPSWQGCSSLLAFVFCWQWVFLWEE